MLNTWASLRDHFDTPGQRDVQQDQQRAGRSHLPPSSQPERGVTWAGRRRDGRRERRRVISHCLYMRSSTSLLLLHKTKRQCGGMFCYSPNTAASKHACCCANICTRTHADTHLDTRINISHIPLGGLSCNDFLSRLQLRQVIVAGIYILHKHTVWNDLQNKFKYKSKYICTNHCPQFWNHVLNSHLGLMFGVRILLAMKCINENNVTVCDLIK